MRLAALGLVLAYVVVAFGARTWWQLKTCGDTGFRGLSGARGSVQWWAGVLFALALVAGFAGPVAGLLGLPDLPVVDRPWIGFAGAGMALFGMVGTVMSQLAMGASWRVGVDASERTSLVVDGPFAFVRNPVFTAMLVTGAGIALMVPNLVAVLGWVALLVAVEIQVRVVEEPYLELAHGDGYRGYAAHAGRFVPGVGTVRPAGVDR